MYRELELRLLEITGGKQSMTPNQFAQYLGLAPQAVREHIRRGKLPGKYIKGKERDTFLIPVPVVVAWMLKASEVKEA
jgi:hypothetical protein